LRSEGRWTLPTEPEPDGCGACDPPTTVLMLVASDLALHPQSCEKMLKFSQGKKNGRANRARGAGAASKRNLEVERVFSNLRV